MRLDQSNVVVIVFKLPGCGACAEHLPVVRQISARYPQIPVVVIDGDAADPASRAQVARYQVSAFPTTVVALRGAGSFQLEGAADPREVEEQIFQRALRAQQGYTA